MMDELVNGFYKEWEDILLPLSVGIVLCALFGVFLRKKLKVKYAISISILVLLQLSFIGNIALLDNYLHNLIPNINDGIGISNPIAYLMIGEDNRTVELFRHYFEMSLYISVILIVMFLCSVTYEAIIARRTLK